MSRFSAFTAAAVLVFIAVLCALQLAMGSAPPIAGEALPMWPSLLALVIALALAALLLYEVRRFPKAVNREAPSGAGPAATVHEPVPTVHAPTPAAQRLAPATRGLAVESVRPAAVPRIPARYFLFSSAGVSIPAIRSAHARYGNIMVGFDSGDIPAASLKVARELGAQLEIYVEGPGGPTGSSWSADERERVRKAAQSVGIDTSRADWMKKEWDRHGWKEYAFRQLEGYLQQGYKSAEIDNLDRVIGDSPGALITFYKEYAGRVAAQKAPQLIMKNISETQLAQVVEAVKSGRLPRSMFSEFHISEKDSGNREKQGELTASIGIRTLASNNTYEYDAKGEFGLEQQFAEAYAREDGQGHGSGAAVQTA